MRIVFVGYAVKGSRTRQRIRAIGELGHELVVIDTAPEGRTYESRPTLVRRIRYRLRRPADETDANARLLEDGPSADLVWIENASMIRPATLAALRAAAAAPALVWYSEDDMMRPHNGSVYLDRSWPLYDLCVTTKSFNARPEELPARGARRVLFTNNAYDPALHRRVEPSADDLARFGADVTFVGTFEAQRAQSVLALARAGISVRVWGNGWASMKDAHPRLHIEGRPVYDDEYAHVVAASRINLGFLRKANRDVQTTRSIELPACGGFMLHEYSDEMAGLLKPEEEASYFRTDADLVAASRRWLNDDDSRRGVADAGHRRVLAAGLRHHDMLERAFAAAFAS